jgi:hypothetical protein
VDRGEVDGLVTEKKRKEQKKTHQWPKRRVNVSWAFFSRRTTMLVIAFKVVVVVVPVSATPCKCCSPLGTLVLVVAMMMVLAVTVTSVHLFVVSQCDLFVIQKIYLRIKK